MAQGYYAQPAYCSGCKDIMMVNVHGRRPTRCRKCGGRLSYIELPSDLLDGFEESQQGFRCPKCGRPDMEISYAGMWD